jgi:hypothetical protein
MTRETLDTDTFSGSIRVSLVSAASRGLAAAWPLIELGSEQAAVGVVPRYGLSGQGRFDWSLNRQQNGLGPSLGMWPEQLNLGISSGDDHSSSSKHLVCTPHRSTYVISSSASGRSATSWNNLSSLTQSLAMPAVSISA